MAPPLLRYSPDDRRRTRPLGCSCHVCHRRMLVSPFMYYDYSHRHLHLQHASIPSTVASSSRQFLETTLHAFILGIRGGIALSGLYNCTKSTVQTPPSVGHTFERSLLGSDPQPASPSTPCGHLGRQPQSLRKITQLTDYCLVYQWNDPRSQDLDFRWQLFWDVIWKSNLAYIVLAEIWLATESYFGLGAVAVRPPSSAGAPAKKSTPAPS